MEGNRRPEPGSQGKRVNTLDSINASFVIIRDRAKRENRALDVGESAGQPSRTLEKINNSFEIARLRADLPEERTEEDSHTALIWNLATGVLVVALIAAVAVFIVMIWRGNSGTGNESALNTSETEEQTEALSDRETETSAIIETDSSDEGVQDSSDTETAESGRDIPDEYLSVLEEEEIEEWKNRETDNSRLFVQMNQSLSIDSENQAYLRLINPPYSAFDIHVKIYTQDEPDTILYQSDVLEPGTILEYVTFDSVPEAGEYEGIVQYTVYDQDGDTVGTHEVTVEITVQ